MADEFIHKDVGSELSEAEYDGLLAHILNNQARGDLIISNTAGTGLIRLALAAVGAILQSDGNDPAWLAIGTANQLLAVNAAANNVEWQSVGPAVMCTFTSNTSSQGTLVGNDRNVTSVTRVSEGLYTINFTVNLSSSDYYHFAATDNSSGEDPHAEASTRTSSIGQVVQWDDGAGSGVHAPAELGTSSEICYIAFEEAA